MVDGVGVDALEEGGLIDEEGNLADDATSASLSEEDAAAAADAFTGCIDMEEYLTKSVGGDLTDEQLTCIQDKFSDEDFNSAMKAGFMGDDDTAAALFQDLFSCMM